MLRRAACTLATAPVRCAAAATPEAAKAEVRWEATKVLRRAESTDRADDEDAMCCCVLCAVFLSTCVCFYLLFVCRIFLLFRHREVDVFVRVTGGKGESVDSLAEANDNLRGGRERDWFLGEVA